MGQGTPGEGEHGAVRHLHPYTLASIACAAAGVLVQIGLGLMWLWVRGLGLMLALETLPISGVLAACAVGAGIHTLVKVRWPGETAYEHARRPGRRDVLFVAAAVAVAMLNMATQVGWVLGLEWHL